MKINNIYFTIIVLLLTVLSSTTFAAKDNKEYSQDESTKAFLTWFKDMGGKATGVTVGISESMGRGVFATETLKQDDPVLSVPLSMCMCRDTALHDKSKRVRKAYKSLRDDEDLVALFILREISKGSRSTFEPYLKVLPKRVPLTSFFSENELNALQDKRRVSDAKRRARQLRNRFKKLSRHVKDLFKDIPEKKRRNKYSDYAWAVAVVGSRALSMSGTKYLVPFADMFNYAPHHEEREANNGAEFLRYHKVQRGNFNVFADRACTSGNQLVEDYGDNTNSLYINHHGFVVEENPFDCVELDMPKINRKEKLRYKLATRMHLNTRPPVCIQPGKKHLPKVLTDHFKALAFSDDWVDKCLKWLGKDNTKQPSEEAYNKCFSKVDASILTRSRRLFHDALKTKLKSYPTTYDEDKLLLESSGKSNGGLLSVKLNYHEIIAIKYRMAQKRLLSLLMVEHGAKAHTVSSGGEGSSSDDGVAGKNKNSNAAELEQQKSDEAKAKAFNEWFATFNAPVNKIEARAVPGMRIGTITTEHVKAEEVYLAVPEDALMDSDSAQRCDALGPMFDDLKKKHPRGDKFHELLIHLIYERFVRNTDSFWWPYLNVIPSLKEMHAPAVSFTDSELDELRGSEIFDAIQVYKDKIRRKYKGVNKHLFSKYKKILPPEVYTYDNYRWSHAILDSRRIWWNGEGHLTPMLDLINCMEGPDPSRVHSTRLDNTGKNAITKAPWEFKKGEQLFEPYGQPNHIYLMYHGFILQQNSHDCVRINFELPSDDPNFDSKRNDILQNRIHHSTTLEACIAVGKIRGNVFEFLRVVHDEQSRKRLYTILNEKLKEKLAKYLTSVEEDEKLLDQGKLEDGTLLNYHLTTAIKFRMSEKKLLKELMDWSFKKSGVKMEL